MGNADSVKKEAIHDAEDSRVCTDAHGERQDSDDSKPRILPEHTDRVTDVLNQSIHGEISPCSLGFVYWGWALELRRSDDAFAFLYEN